MQALALARLARPRPAVLLRRRQGVPRQLAARPHQPRPAPHAAHRPVARTSAASSTSSTSTSTRSIRKAVDLRERLATEIDEDDPARNSAAKHRQLAELHRGDRRPPQDRRRRDRRRPPARRQARQGARRGLRQPAPGREAGASRPERRRAPISAWLDGIIDRGLTPTVPTDYERWQPLHWVLEAPDVIVEHGGFDAVVGNPPFLGGQEAHRRDGHRQSATGSSTRLPAGRRAALISSPTSSSVRAARSCRRWQPRADRHEHRRAGRHPRGRPRPHGRPSGFTITRAIQSSTVASVRAPTSSTPLFGAPSRRQPPELQRVADGRGGAQRSRRFSNRRAA